MYGTEYSVWNEYFPFSFNKSTVGFRFLLEPNSFFEHSVYYPQGNYCIFLLTVTSLVSRTLRLFLRTYELSIFSFLVIFLKLPLYCNLWLIKNMVLFV